MVCGLWTPGTRCPNVNTMSAFDVPGVSRGKENVHSLLESSTLGKEGVDLFIPAGKMFLKVLHHHFHLLLP
ncbi:hypothetical protein PVK06_022393 [Gossypium arboreum]|uniref:Uncharacterized protein n=1 Tax=Gossypium arboreum TaxID=29729 RepID=A0ABR0P8G2_GOSAR|nr:hypothetical protein PVK06_022393 [Gossypium arboreum]